MTPAARSWLARPELTRLWDTLHERLQRNGIAIRGRLAIPDPSHAEREALALLMGRTYPAGTITIALADLDERLRSSAAGCGAADAVTELRGRLTDRPAVRSARRAERDQVRVAADEAMAAAGLADAPWAPGWLEEIRRGGALSRLAPDRAVSLIAQAVGVLSRLVPQVQPPGQAGIAPAGIAPAGIAPAGIAPA
ncbi:MAG: TIGR02679 domain-containing protein, partial [Streptosporangiaceae bacterium]